MPNKYDVESNPHFPRPRIQNGGKVPVREPILPGVPDIEQAPMKYIALALVHLRNELAKLPVMLEDNSHPVDEYQPQELIADATSNITLNPQWEVPEIIRAVLITGPAGAVTLQLGDRTWNLTIPAAGFILISPLWLLLSRSDNRILTAASAGNYTLELMGHADTRGNLI